MVNKDFRLHYTAPQLARSVMRLSVN